jgi:hypothetical protein
MSPENTPEYDLCEIVGFAMIIASIAAVIGLLFA